MKSIFSTQNLQTFFLRKYWRLPRGRPPGPPPGPCPPPCPPEPSRRGAPLGACVCCFCSSAITACLSNFVKTFSSQEPASESWATVAFAAVPILRSTSLICLLLKGGGKTAALQN